MYFVFKKQILISKIFDPRRVPGYAGKHFITKTYIFATLFPALHLGAGERRSTIQPPAMANTLKTSELFTDDIIDKLIAKFHELGNEIEKDLGKIKTEAAGMKKSIEGVNTTTAAGREEVNRYSQVVAQLNQAQSRYLEVQSQQKQKIEELKVATRTLNELKKNEARFTLSAEGSYNRLSAQYNIIKLSLNAMSKEQRENTKEGRELVKTAKQIFEEMKRLQAETGKTALNVGNYSDAIDKAVMNLGEMKQELLALRNISFEGKTQQEIDQINRRIGELTDSMADLRAEQTAYGTETGALVAGSFKFFAAGIEGIVASTKLLGIQSPVLDKLQNSVVELIAVSQALGAIEDVLQKKTLQATAARIKSIAINAKDTVSKWANGVATTAAARAEDARTVALARGSVVTRGAAAVQWLWNAALAANPIGLVITGVAALVAGIVLLTRVMRDNTDEIERQSQAYGKLVEARKLDEALTKQKIALAREQGQADTEITRLELEAARKRREALFREHQDFLKILYSKKKASDDEKQRNEDYFRERKEVAAEIQILETRLTRQEKEAAEERAKTAEQEAERARAERERLQKQKEAQIKEIQDAQLKELEAQKNYEIAKLDSERDYSEKSKSYQDQQALLRFETEQTLQTAILDKQKEFGRITETEYKAALERMKAEFKKFQADLASETSGFANALGRAIESGLGGNNNAPPAFLAPLENAFDSSAEKRMKNLAAGFAKSSMEGLAEGAEESTLSLSERLSKTMDGFWEGLGLDDQEMEGLKTALDFAKQQLADYMASVQKAADARVKAADDAVRAAEEEYNLQTKLQSDGLAHRAQTAAKELDLAKANQRKALEEQRRVQRQQIILQSVEQASNLVTAVSKVYASLGFPAGLIASGLMISAFLGAKIKALQATKQTFGEGDLSVLEGGSHASGRDIFIGSQKGKKQFAEGGEARMILSKRMTRKYMEDGTLPAVFHALKKGVFHNKFEQLDAAGRDLRAIHVFNQALPPGTDTRKVEQLLGQLVKQGEANVVVNGNTTISRWRGWTFITTKVA